MNFSNLKPVKQANPKVVYLEIPSSIVEGRPKRIIEQQGFNSYPKVYQYCDTCKREINWYILNEVVTCLGCKNSYKLVKKENTVFDFERI